jgi:hypothetical protein
MARMFARAGALWIGLAAAVGAVAAPPGTYRLNERETASELRLDSGGRYQWFYSQGSMDLESQGDWRQEGGRIRLTAMPKVIPSDFSLLSAREDGEPGLRVLVRDPDGERVTGADVVAATADGRQLDAYTQDGQARVALPAGAAVTSVSVGIGAAGVPMRRFAVAPMRGGTVTVVFHPNDFGREDLDGAMLRETPKGMELEWRGQRLRYARTPGGR